MQGGLQSDQSSSFTDNERTQVAPVRAASSATIRRWRRSSPSTGNNAAGGFLINVNLKPKQRAFKDAVQPAVDPAPAAQARPAWLARASSSTPRKICSIGGRQGAATYQFTLEGPDLTLLREWAGKLAEALKSDPALSDVNTDQEDHGLETYVTVDRDASARLGITNTAIDNTLYDAFGQRQVSTIYRESNQYKVVMEAAPSFAHDPTALSNIYVSSGSAAVATPTQGAMATSSAAARQSTGLGAGAGASLAVGQTAVAGPAAPPGRAASQGVAVSTAQERITPLSALATMGTISATPTSGQPPGYGAFRQRSRSTSRPANR